MKINVVILTYPGCMRSAVEGLRELFGIANNLCKEHQYPQAFSVDLRAHDALEPAEGHAASQVVIVPPCIDGEFYDAPGESLLGWLQQEHQKGAIICSACAGAFILAAAGLLTKRECTTHWILAEKFSKAYPQLALNTDSILINDGDIITAGGLMSWMDLGLELVAQLVNPEIMRQLGKLLVIDTAPRQQRYYQRFSPKFDHGDKIIRQAQHHIQSHYTTPLTVRALAEQCILNERTFLRRFVKATGIKPTEYLQRLRIQKACDLLESTNQTVDVVSLNVGYEDTSAFRKTFNKILGLTPRDFRARFVGEVQ